MKTARILLALAAMAAVSAPLGCDRGDDEITFGDYPKSQPAPKVSPAAAMSTNSQGVGPQRPAAVPLHWSVPEGWVRLPEQQMRVAAFQVDPADTDAVLTVIAMPDQIPLVANLNRWEGQVGLPATAEADLPKVVKKATVAGVSAETIDLLGAGDPAAAKRMLVAVVPHEGQNWYIKLTGLATTIAKAKPGYDAFLASLHFASDGHTHDDHASPQLLTPLTDEAAKLTAFTAPTGWAEQPPRPMRAHTFVTKAGDGAAEVVVVRLSGNNIGPLDANINQWRGQVGLPPLPKEQVPAATRATVGDRQAAAYDFTGNARRIRVAYTVLGTSVWFFKIQGPADEVTKQLPAFEAFLGSVKFPEASAAPVSTPGATGDAR